MPSVPSCNPLVGPSFSLANDQPTPLATAQAKRLVVTVAELATAALDLHPIPHNQPAKQSAALVCVVALMQPLGWAYAGGGFFSLVFVKGGLAIKIGLKSTDSGYIYAAWCRANPELVGVLPIHAIEKRSTCYVVLTDQCYPIGAPTPYQKEEMDECLRYISCSRRTAPTHDIGDTASAIREFFTGIATFDLHNGNMMLDREGNIVITDPVAHSRSDVINDNEYYTYTASQRA